MDVHGGRTDSAVLVPLFCDPCGRLHVVFTKRRDDLRRHAGEISFPGGRRDEGETLLERALREAHEEVGLPPRGRRCGRRAQPIGTFVTNYAIYPFVGMIERRFEWVARRPRWPRCSSSRSRTWWRPLAQAAPCGADGLNLGRL